MKILPLKIKMKIKIKLLVFSGLILLAQSNGCKLFKKDCDCPKFNNGKAYRPAFNHDKNLLAGTKTLNRGFVFGTSE